MSGSLAGVQVLFEHLFPIPVVLLDLFVEKVDKCNGVPERIMSDTVMTACRRESCPVRFLGQELPPRRFVDLVAPDESFINAHQGRDFVLIRLCQLLAVCAERIGGTEKLFPGRKSMSRGSALPNLHVADGCAESNLVRGGVRR